MTVQDLINSTGWTAYGTETSFTKEVQGVFVGDLLSWVMGKGNPDEAWITVQAHLNAVAVAVLREFSCIIIAQDASLNPDFLAKANEEEVAVLHTPLSAYECCKKMVELGL